MSAVEQSSAAHNGHAHAEHHQHQESFISKYIFSHDHKTISKQFLITAIVMATVAMVMSIIFRLQIAFPGESFAFTHFFLGDKWAPDGVLSSTMFLALVTIHGTIMVFFVLTGGLSGTFSNLLIPFQIGARDMASGFINMLSYWFFLAGSIMMLASLFVEGGPAGGGWTVYPPLSVLPQAIPGSGTGMTLWLFSMVLFIAGSLMGSLNYIVTVMNLRTKGMKMTRLPLTVWAFLLTAIVGVLSFPVLVSAVVLLIMDRMMGTSFYLSEIHIAGEALDNMGGSPILYEHLFWFLGHPEVYIIILPAFGISSEIISTMSRKPIFGYRAMIGSLMAISFLSFIVWAHHMFVTGMNPFLGSVFTVTTMMIAIPSAVKVFNYITTLWRGNIVFSPAMLFSIGMVSTFIAGGLTGIILANSALDIQVHDTYFVVAHFHMVMGVSAIFAMMAGVYHWFPRMYGRMMNTKLGYLHFWVTLVAAYGVFIPMHYVGLAGGPRRYYEYTEFPMFQGHVMDLNVMITVFACMGGAIQLVFIYNFFRSIWYGQKATQNPWHSNTLEWTAPVGSLHGNWPGPLPTVYRWPYDYSKPGKQEDYVPQTVPLEAGEEEH
ncbi:MAG: cbb3-type cytochrome c oxidase subunit I [Bacteroidetes bacterium]|nr:cbb3-type cytochrome c oxidase subunit I [Bacteroidota bacterium]MBS1941802.1 cbb3-type cytochrome c oxidase subunit I [Bacteroidota bacterium]